METRLRDDFGSRMDNLQTEINQMRDDFGGRLDNLETETRSIVKDVIRPFIEAAESRHSELVGRLDRLESQVEHNRQKINQVFFKMDMQEKRLYNISDDLAVVRKHIDRLDQFLIGDRTYDLAETQLMMAEGHSLYNVIQDLEKRVSLLEAYAAGMDGGIN
jgi:chromosome segregation ATPase